jgi:hypothetical protein
LDLYCNAKNSKFLVKSLSCPTCSMPVLDEREWCARVHRKHKC